MELSYLGIRTFLSKPAEQAPSVGGDRYLTVYLSTLFLTLTNPSTILSFVAIFAGFRLSISTDYLTTATLVLGVFIGSAFWWLILSTSIGLLKSGVNSTSMRNVNRFSGTLLLGFGLYSLLKSCF